MMTPAVSPFACIILAAGKGTRMRSSLPKVMHKIAGAPMLAHVLAAAQKAGAAKIVTVLAPDMDEVAKLTSPHPVAIQSPALGTGHATLAAKELLHDFTGDVVIMFGDAAMMSAATIEKLLAVRRSASNPAIVIAGFRPQDPARYGRLITSKQGEILEIVEFFDATDEQKAIGLCNGGFMVCDGTKMWDLLAKIGNNNNKNEYYLTDIVAIARACGLSCAVATMTEEEVLGVNSREELAKADALMQKRLRSAAMDNGATLYDPESVYLCHDTKIGRDVTIGPNVVFGPKVEIADNVEIKPFCHLEGVTIKSGAQIGPFARLRPGTVIESDAHVGNFVEFKNATLGVGAKANHLAYIGDAVVGAKSNIGAGAITCNYDGVNKHKTEIGAGAFIGSNAALVAPLKIGDGALIAAGSTITQDVAADAMAVARARVSVFPEWAKRRRETLKKSS